MFDPDRLLSIYNPDTGELAATKPVERHLADLRGCFADPAAYASALDWLQQDSGAATEWLAGRPQSVNLSSVVQNWAGQDPETCSAWLNTLPTGEMKDGAIHGLVTGIRWHDPQMAGAWAAQAGSTALREKLVKEVEEVTQAISVTEP